MATPDGAHPRRGSSQKLPFSPSPATSSALRPNAVKNVFLYDWWLIKTGPDSHGRRLGIEGFEWRRKQGSINFISSPIAKRHNAVTLKTVDGMAISINGLLNRSRTLQNGFSNEICDHFACGFPYDWEEFATLTFDDNKTPMSRDDESNMLKNIFDAILQYKNGESGAKKEISPGIEITESIPDEPPSTRKKQKASRRRGDCNVEVIEHIGPLTRSRTKSRLTL